jgi:hypothetical protein
MDNNLEVPDFTLWNFYLKPDHVKQKNGLLRFAAKRHLK